MIAKDISKQKFDVLMSKGIELDRCPICGANGEIVVLLPWYGNTGEKVRCSKCKYSTKIFDIHSHFYCAETKTLGTPILEKSLMRGNGYYGDVAFIATSDMRTFYCPVNDIKGWND